MSLLLITTLIAASYVDDTVIDGLKSKVPDGWKEVKTTSNMRVKEYVLPQVDGDKDVTSLIVYFFGKGSGGDLKANIERWKKQFNPPEGKTIEDVSKLSDMKVGEVKVTLLDVNGTYKESMPSNPNAPTVEKKDHRMWAVVFESPNGPYYFKVVGPSKSMAANEKSFMEWLKNFK